MDESQIARMIYLVLLGTVLVSYFLVSQRRNLAAALRQAILWALIFVGVVLAYGLWEDITDTAVSRQSLLSEGQVAVPRARDGHYYLTLAVHGVDVRFIVDTGASNVVLSQEDARRVGFDPDRLVYSGQARSANGVVRTARVWLETVQLEGYEDRDVAAWVNRGELDVSLLGMSYLERYQRIEIERNRLILVR